VVVELPIVWTGLLNVLAWLIIQLGLAWVMTRIPGMWFNPRAALARLWNWEGDGRYYEKLFFVKHWKDRLPDAASWFKGGFPKATLRTNTPDFFENFLRETWRGEVTHWLAILALPIFAIWNPRWGFAVNAAYAIAANLPCILVQRYNRSRFIRLLKRMPK